MSSHWSFQENISSNSQVSTGAVAIGERDCYIVLVELCPGRLKITPLRRGAAREAETEGNDQGRLGRENA